MLLVSSGPAGSANPGAGAQVSPPAGWTPGQRTAPCMVVEVRTPDGHPVAGAVVEHFHVDPASNRDPGGGRSWIADAGGRVCEEQLLDPGYLWVSAPDEVGGWCAGFEQLRHRGWQPGSGRPPAMAVTLHLRRLWRSRIVGRIIDAAGHPVAGARVLAEDVFPKGTECSTQGSAASTDSGGKFRLPPTPHGRATLDVSAPDFAERRIDVEIPSSPRVIPLDSGAEWTGRVIDPEGMPIERCTIQVRTRDRIQVAAACSPAGFVLHHIPPGELELHVRIYGPHPTLGSTRVLLATVHLAPDELRNEDIVWPAGAVISGTAVTEDGAPVPGAEVLAISADVDRASAGDEAGATAASDGRFTFQHLGPGDWKLVGDRRNVSEQGSLTVSAGATGVRLVVPASKGTLSRPDRRP